MSQKKSDFHRGWGKMTVVVNAVIDAILAAGGDDEDVARLETLAPQIATMTIAARPPQAEAETVEEQPTTPKEEVEDLGWIELDPAVSFPDRITACDFKGGAHPNITADKSKLKRKVRRHIVLYSGSGSTKEMRRRIRANGDRPSDVDDGTGIGKIFPERQVGNPLVLLDEGSVCLDDLRNQCAPVLNYWDRKRKFCLILLAGDWDVSCRFPAVREEEFLDT